MKKQVLLRLVAEKLVKYGAGNLPLVIGVSGGVDSMVLLDVVRQLVFAQNLTVVHVDHGLRKSAKRDAELVAAYCSKHGLNYRLRGVDVAAGRAKDKGSVEEVARELRYRALEEEAVRVGAIYILLAHHADDQAETMVFNMVRGASLRGMGGMKELNGKKLRPLLSVRKQELASYAKQVGLKFATDETNKDTKYTRNLIRLKVMPILAGINPDVVMQLGELSASMQSAEDAVRDLARLHVAAMAKATPGRLELPISRLLELTGFMRAEVLKFATEMLGVADYEWSVARLSQIDKLLKSSEAKAEKRMPGKLLVEKRYDKISISLY